MDNNYFKNISTNQNYIPIEHSYIENVLRLNKGKKVSIYQSFSGSNEWKDKVFAGIIEHSGKDHIILSDPSTGIWYFLLTKYIDYISFEEDINTSSQFYQTNK